MISILATKRVPYLLAKQYTIFAPSPSELRLLMPV